MRGADRDAAFTEFVHARQAHLRRIAYAICGDRHLAEDLLQTALTKLYLAWPRIQRQGTEEAYVRQILVRSHIDTVRRASSREVVGVEDRDRVAAAGTPYEERSTLSEGTVKIHSHRGLTALEGALAPR